MVTEARINSKTGIADHRHEGKAGWHWACAGHFIDGTMNQWDDGAKHRAAGAANPSWADGGSAEDREAYNRALTRQVVHFIDGHVEHYDRPQRQM